MLVIFSPAVTPVWRDACAGCCGVTEQLEPGATIMAIMAIMAITGSLSSSYELFLPHLPSMTYLIGVSRPVTHIVRSSWSAEEMLNC